MTGKPILITGSHRSGTTWVGKMIARSESVVYIQEPFNIRSYRPGICNIKFENWFTYINDKNESLYFNSLKQTIQLRYNLVAGIKQNPSSFKNWIKQLLYYCNFSCYRFKGRRALIKDPIAILSAEWMVKRFDMQAIVLIRHPAAFVASIIQKDWFHPFKHFLNQPLLMNDHLARFKPEIEAFTAHPPGIIEQACLLWRIIYYIVSWYQQNHENWLYLRHEDISTNPIGEFRKIFNNLNLEFTNDIQNYIIAYSEAKDPSPDLLKRNSLANISTWKQRLSTDEIAYIKSKVSDISQIFYSEDDWN